MAFLNISSDSWYLPDSPYKLATGYNNIIIIIYLYCYDKKIF